MKITAQFPMSQFEIVRNLRNVSLMFSFVLLLLAAWLGSDSLGLREKVAASSLRLQVLKNEVGKHEQISLPSSDELKHISTKIEEINHTLHGHTGHFSSLLYHFEQIIPNQVFLTSLSYKQRSSELVVTASSSNAKKLAAFVHSLDVHPDISEVLYSKQLHSQKKRGLSSVEIRMRLSD